MKRTQKDNRMAALWRSSHMNGSNAHYVEQLFERYLDAPASVPDQWRRYFDTLEEGNVKHVPLSSVRERCKRRGSRRRVSSAVKEAHPVYAAALLPKVRALMDAWRRHGHKVAAINPLGLSNSDLPAELLPAFHGLETADLERVLDTCALDLPAHMADCMTVRAIHEWLAETYAGALAVELPEEDQEARRWWLKCVESEREMPALEDQRRLLEQLNAADGFERYLAGRYPGAKRFGLEGCDALIPLMDTLLRHAAGKVSHVTVGMAHRGRLNMLVNVLGKSPAAVIDEFEGRAPITGSSGDVKYHLGFVGQRDYPTGTLSCELVPNPSHLEIVTPVMQGCARARRDLEGATVLPVALHGDAAFAGQGVVMEALQMSQTRAFSVDGTVHIVLNNQVGFTTSRVDDARSTRYCTGLARGFDLPVLHVNADDIDAVWRAARMALDWRQHSGRDVVIDLVGYRRRGHNEADEPSGTQPLMYASIRDQSTALQHYTSRLVSHGVVSFEESSRQVDEYRAWLDSAVAPAAPIASSPSLALAPVSQEMLAMLGQRTFTVPVDITLQRQVARTYEERLKMVSGERPLNWGAAELLAYATLLEAGRPIRLIGQDSGRGTFSHRHAVLHDQLTGRAYLPLSHLSPAQAPCVIHDSLLSEEAVLAFEYGFAVTAPQALVLWEAQFGDFANGAQVVIDQFIASGAAKWGQRCGLVLLLPHGYEGQGPEHSSARPERFLQLCAEDNMLICAPTTPAQMFHLLRRQAAQAIPVPLIVMQPKSLLRRPEAVSSMAELANGQFYAVFDDTDIDHAKVTRVVLTAGKVYYDLMAHRRQTRSENTALIRIEQLYPFPVDILQDILSRYPALQTLIWCQEEPRNQGYWQGVRDALDDVASTLPSSVSIRYAGRAAAAAPSTGSSKRHEDEQQALLQMAFNA